jgi:hypothetical protein
MTHIYRITRSSDVGALVDSVEALEAFARELGPGCYTVDEHSLDSFEGSNAKARGWGTIIHQPDGRIALKPFFFGYHYAVQDLPDSRRSRQRTS